MIRCPWALILILVGSMLLSMHAAQADSQQIGQVNTLCRESGRERPDTSCSNCHSGGSQGVLNDKGERFKSNLSGNPEWVLTNFCPLRAAGGSATRAKPVLMVQDSVTVVANVGTVSFSATDPQGARLKLKVLGQPKGMQFRQSKASGITYNGFLSWPKNAKPALPGTYRLTVSASQVSRTPRLSTSTGLTLVVVSQTP